MTTLRLCALLRRPVEDDAGHRLGVVHDIAAAQVGPVTAGFDAAVTVTALVVGARGVRARLGLNPAHVRGPWLVRILARVGRPTDTIPWDDVVAIETDRVVVRRRTST